MSDQHSHSHGDSHSHEGSGLLDGHTHDLRGTSKRRLVWAMVLVVGYMVVEIVASIVSGSLALLAHAGHMLTDALCIGIALVAMRVAEKRATKQHTYGFERYEVMAALANALVLWLLVGGILMEAYDRIVEHGHAHDHGHDHTPDGLIMTIVGLLGFVVHFGAAVILHRSVDHSVNVAGVYQHVRADLLGSVVIAISGGLILWNPWEWLELWVDPVLGVILGIVILGGTWGLLKQVFRVLLEGVPKHIDVHALCRSIETLPGVVVIHDIHVWTLSQGSDALTAHVVIGEHVTDREAMLDQLKKIVSDQYKINHMTIQLESNVARCTEDHHVDNLLALVDS